MFCCPRLWFGERAFPRVPVVGILPDLPVTLANGLSVGFVVALLLVLVLPEPKKFLTAAFTLGFVLVAFDINRLQPWFYQYLLVLAALSFTKILAEKIGIVSVILASTYIWGGIQKVNLSFAKVVAPELFGDFIRPVWFLVPLIEILVGVFLLVPRTRLIGIVGAVLMHAVLLFDIGPLGRNLNSVIWPWNFWMIAMVLIVFVKNTDSIENLSWNSAVGKAITVLVCLLPGLNFFGYWDDYLSATLYSGRSVEGYIFVTDEGAKFVPKQLDPYLIRHLDRIGFDVFRWSMAELNVPSYPQPRVFQSVARSLVNMGIPEKEMTLVLTDRPGLITSQSATRIWPIP